MDLSSGMILHLAGQRIRIHLLFPPSVKDGRNRRVIPLSHPFSMSGEVRLCLITGMEKTDANCIASCVDLLLVIHGPGLKLLS